MLLLRLRLWRVENARVVAVGRIRVELRIVKPTRETATARIDYLLGGEGGEERTNERAPRNGPAISGHDAG